MESLDSRFEKYAAKRYSIYAEICGKRVELRFASKEYAAIIERCLARWLIPNVPKPDALFYFWRDDCLCHISEEDSSERRRYKNEDGWVVYQPKVCLIGASVSHRTFYYCLYLPEKQDPIPYWAVSTLVYQ